MIGWVPRTMSVMGADGYGSSALLSFVGDEGSLFGGRL